MIFLRIKFNNVLQIAFFFLHFLSYYVELLSLSYLKQDHRSHCHSFMFSIQKRPFQNPTLPHILKTSYKSTILFEFYFELGTFHLSPHLCISDLRFDDSKTNSRKFFNDFMCFLCRCTSIFQIYNI